CRARGRQVPMNDALAADIADVCRIWRDCRAAKTVDGEFLFGAFSAADAFFAPVVMRFLTYQPELPDDTQPYIEAIRQHPWLQEWVAAARAEPQVIEHEEVGIVD
ncbi:MAG: glutathione S-transferase C-terminal domain-containing protein, partial [Pseudomonadota bacterium]